MELNKDEYDEWMAHPTTKKVLGAIRDLRAGYSESLSVGNSLVKASAEQTAIQTAGLVGKIAGLDEILNLDSE